MDLGSISEPPEILKMPFDAIRSEDGSIHFHYTESVDITKSEYYKYRIFLINYINSKRTINDFLARQMREEKPDVHYMNILNGFVLDLYFYLTYPMLDKDSFSQILEQLLSEMMSPGCEHRMDDNMTVGMLQNFCLGILSERIQELHGSVPARILYGEFLRIIDATVEYFTMNQTMHIEQFINMFMDPPKLMSEQWNPIYSSAICIYPWRAFELVSKLEEFMRGKKDKEAMLYVHAAIEAGVVHREWKRFEMQFGTKYCSRKTYDKYTDRTQKYSYYTQEELKPLIKFFRNFKPYWAKKS